MKINVGSRDSVLAVVQSNLVIEAVRRFHSELEIELITMKTTGDKILDRTLDKVGGKGLFVKELDQALLDRRADITVHSYKDMPMELTPGLPVVAVSSREDPRDALVLPPGVDHYDPANGPIGSSSLRRTLQLRALFPDAEIKPVRGNLQTRLRKLDSGEYGALVLACAGLRRLGLEDRIARVFEPQEILPAACQGVLAVQSRSGFDISFLDEFNDPTVMRETSAERAFVRALDGGCSSPVAAYCTADPDGLYTLTGLYADAQNRVYKQTVRGTEQEIEQKAARLALAMKKEYAE